MLDVPTVAFPPQPNTSPTASEQAILQARTSQSGNFICVGGLLATDASGHVIPGHSRTQTDAILDHVATLLKSVGSSVSNVATVNVYLRSQADYGGMNQALRAAWSIDPPARTTVMVHGLADPAARVEISMLGLVEGAER
jgi:enamine deaminase RidA (YjgF/YER057c/UK114 family)